MCGGLENYQLHKDCLWSYVRTIHGEMKGMTPPPKGPYGIHMILGWFLCIGGLREFQDYVDVLLQEHIGPYMGIRRVPSSRSSTEAHVGLEGLLCGLPCVFGGG